MSGIYDLTMYDVRFRMFSLSGICNLLLPLAGFVIHFLRSIEAIDETADGITIGFDDVVFVFIEKAVGIAVADSNLEFLHKIFKLINSENSDG